MVSIEKHPYFDLWLHSTDELERILRIKIATRETIHDWPLSTVQKITTVDGNSIIYKVQRRATVEPKFYKSATSRLLPKYEYLGKVNDCEAMTFEFIHGKRLTDCDVDEPNLIRMGRELQSEIRNIQGDLPVFTDIGDPQKWNNFAKSVLERLTGLIEQQLFPSMDISLVGELTEWANGSVIADIVNNESCFTHGDPNGDNIFVLPDGYKLIDWQRPRYAPRDVDMVGLLLGRGFNPYPHVKREVVQIFCFLRIDWFTLCMTTLIPGGTLYERYVIDASESLLRQKVPAKWGEL
jgi:Phosphotransferase enzyme family